MSKDDNTTVGMASLNEKGELAQLRNEIAQLKVQFNVLEKAFASSSINFNRHIADLHVQRIG